MGIRIRDVLMSLMFLIVMAIPVIGADLNTDLYAVWSDGGYNDSIGTKDWNATNTFINTTGCVNDNRCTGFDGTGWQTLPITEQIPDMNIYTLKIHTLGSSNVVATWPVLIGKANSFGWDISGTTWRGRQYDGTWRTISDGVQTTTWRTHVIRYNGSEFAYFTDGVLQGSVQANDNIVGAGSVDVLGYLADNNCGGASACWKGYTDEIYLYNRSLNDSEILQLNDTFYPFVTADESNIDLIFSNTTHPLSFKTVFGEGEDFHVWVNWTDASDGSPLNDSVGACNVSLIDGIVSVMSSLNDSLFCSAGCDYVTYTEELTQASNDSVRFDGIHFDVCHEQVGLGDVDVSMSCGTTTMNDTILAEEFGLCSAGKTTVFSTMWNDCQNHTRINASITFDGAFARRKNISMLDWDREFAIDVNTYDDGDVLFNSSLDMWKTDHNHEYYIHGSKEIFANCTHLTSSGFNNHTSENITIENVNPVISIEQVLLPNGSIIPLSDGDVLPFLNGTYELIISFEDDDLDSIRVNITNSTGDLLINWTSIEDFNASSLLFLEDDYNPYTLSAWANDSNGNITLTSITFNVSDDVDPECDFVNASQTVDTNYTFSVTCTDENFFSLNVSCPDYSFFDDGLNVISYPFTGTFLVTQDNECVAEFCDGHTAKEKTKDWKPFRPETDRIEFIVDNRMIADLWVLDGELEFEDDIDRVKFTAKFDDMGKPYQTIYYNASPSSVFIDSSEYLAWVGDSSSRAWFDLENAVTDDITTLDRGGGLWEFRIVTPSDEIEFYSIGEFNCVNMTFTINATTPTGVGADTNTFESVQEAMFFYLLVIVWLLFMAGSIFARGVHGKRIQLFNIVQVFISIVLGLQFMSINTIMGILFILTGIGVFFGVIFNPD